MSNKKMPEQYSTLFKQLLEGSLSRPWREACLERMIHLDMHPSDCLELRVRCSPEDGDLFALARRAVSLFFTAFHFYPTALAAHSTMARLFEITERVFKAEFRLGGPDVAVAVLGEGFEAQPIHVIVDNTLDIYTVAVRFSVDIEECKETAKNMIQRKAKEKEGQR